jgi:hypothetical protein
LAKQKTLFFWTLQSSILRPTSTLSNGKGAASTTRRNRWIDSIRSDVASCIDVHVPRTGLRPAATTRLGVCVVSVRYAST